MTGTQWVTEAAHGYGNTVEVTELLYAAQSPYQKIEIFETRKLGRMLMLDGIIQLTEFDEFAYQEMMAHLPLFAHPAPERVLVVGGGDGGVLREIARHSCVKRIDICEIDGMVIDACRKYLPSLACGYEDPRVVVHVGDGCAFVKEHPGEFDVVIIDSTDPVGPGELLFGADFYAAVRRALRPGGVMASQSESVYLFPEIVRRLAGFARANFPFSAYAMFAVPTYPTGTIGACVAGTARAVTAPAREPDAALQNVLRYYTPAIHRAAFQLPAFAERMLREC